MNKKNLTTVMVVAFAAVFVGAVFSAKYFNSGKHFDPSLLHGTLFTQPRALKPFTLTTAAGKKFTQADLKGHWTFLFFGFTRCPNICPTTMNTLKGAFSLFDKKGIKPMPHMVMVSVDPDFDTPARTNTYAQQFDGRFNGVSGTPEQVKAITEQLNVLYTKMQTTAEGASAEDSYTIDHSGSIMLINPKGQWAGLFSSPNAQEILDDYSAIVTHFG